MNGGYKAKSDTGPALPTNAGVDKDHGGGALGRHAQRDQSYTQSDFMNGFTSNPDRQNVKQPIPSGTDTSNSADQKGGLMDKGHKPHKDGY